MFITFQHYYTGCGGDRFSLYFIAINVSPQNGLFSMLLFTLLLSTVDGMDILCLIGERLSVTIQYSFESDFSTFYWKTMLATTVLFYHRASSSTIL